ncbi:MAG: ABC transporter substrate-binding protein [Vicinamibacterales bacterium]
MPRRSPGTRVAGLGHAGAVVALAAACAASAVLPVRGGQPDAAHASGPRRIVSLVPALTEMLFAIGAGPQVAAVSSFDTYPPDVATRPRVGALLDPDVERILSLAPDLVAIYGSQTDLRRQLERASIPVYDYRHAGLPDVMTTILELGKITGHAPESHTVVAGLKRRIDAVRARVAGRPRVRTLLVFGREPGALRRVFASGGRGFLHDMLRAAGGENVFADVAQESVQATTEVILTRAPDVILEVREGPELPAVERQRLAADWARLAAVPAVKMKRIVVVSGDGLVVPGPRVAGAVERFARALHPEAFR